MKRRTGKQASTCTKTCSRQRMGQSNGHQYPWVNQLKLERLVLVATNREGSRKHSARTWKPMNETDLRAYVGLLILAGMYRSWGEAAVSLWNAEFGRAIFRATMSLKDFYRYSKTLRFDDRESRHVGGRSSDKLAAIREVWDMWCERLPALYNPGPDVTVDERIVPFKGRCSFLQYMPMKPAKYGLKLWVACKAKTSYAWRMQAYTGRQDASATARERNLALRVVLDLTQGLEHRMVTCDNFFTSYELARVLRNNNITKLVSVHGRQVFSSRFALSELATLVSYVPKRGKTVLLLSIGHPRPKIDSQRKDRKPHLILDYNRTKGGVDNLDKVLAGYSCRRMTERWPVALFHNIIDVSAYNAYVIWRETHPEWMPGKRNRRRLFLEQLGKDLFTPLIMRREHAPRAEPVYALMSAVREACSDATAPQRSEKRKRCQLCPRTDTGATHNKAYRYNMTKETGRPAVVSTYTDLSAVRCKLELYLTLLSRRLLLFFRLIHNQQQSTQHAQLPTRTKATAESATYSP
ncbi:piggyBac transposable element-derived protein 4-like [Scophthalmus maximus]|uniref:piggyBac transposable element-derived protein 4-like n=1 Tax=Scophthalmus maximus TaxID=52904 RepID=UPI0015E13840|nr:piggyBac transposable element-derived protein 4-like [Scophthalmus maximus]